MLLQSGHDVQIHDKNKSLFLGASGFNQNRLHMGFHYPRCSKTRFQSREGFKLFILKYGFLTKVVDRNFYAVADNDSMIDFATFKQIMTASDLKYSEINNAEIGLQKCSKLIQVDERVICSTSASQYFLSQLRNILYFNSLVDLQNEENFHHLKGEYDFIIDCSWKTAQSNEKNEVFFEPCVYFQSEFVGKDPFALTLMDGPFFSIYPNQKNQYTITSVTETPLAQCADYKNASRILKSSADPLQVKLKYQRFKEQIRSFFPKFSDQFKNPRPVFSIKTKIRSSIDRRSTEVSISDNVISVFSGKIDNVFSIEQKILEWLL